MSDDFCLIHGQNHMKHDRGPVAYCRRCEDPVFVRAEEIVNVIREYTYGRSHGSGFTFDMDFDAAVDKVAMAIRGEPMRRLVTDHRFTEMWQVKDYVRAVLDDRCEADEACRRVFAE